MNDLNHTFQLFRNWREANAEVTRLSRIANDSVVKSLQSADYWQRRLAQATAQRTEAENKLDTLVRGITP